MTKKALPIVWLALNALPIVSPIAIIAAEPLQFNRDIRPILSDNCFACHGPDAKHREADLRLDLREAAIDFGAIEEGNAKDSEMITRVDSDDPDSVMPPPSAHKKLSAKQKTILRRWIDEGAKYQDHWSFTPIQRPDLPTQTREGSKLGAIDQFIEERLSRDKVKKSELAAASLLVRRLFLDLIGLPPSTQEQEAWTTTIRDQGVGSLVDYLLASKHYGERMAVPWLDVVRFTDTVGYHGDQNQNIFPYRDYVIDAFNENKPFDRFTIEQLAGDLLENPTEQQLIATGFNRLNMMTREGGAQPGEYLARYAADRVRTVGMTWMGATIGCAECHDHKFDPYTAKDFYSLSAFFSDVRQWGVYSSYASSPSEDLKGFTNDYPFPPELEVTSPSLIQHQRLLEKQLMSAVKSAVSQSKDGDQRNDVRDWCQGIVAFLQANPDGWSQPRFIGMKSEVEEVDQREVALSLRSSAISLKDVQEKIVEEASVTEDVDSTANDVTPTIEARPKPDRKAEEKKRTEALKTRTLRYELPEGRLAKLRIELFPNASSSGRIVRGKSASIDIKLKVDLLSAGKKKPQPLNLYYAEADHFDVAYASGQPKIGVESSWKLSKNLLLSPAAAIYWIDSPITIHAGDELSVKLDGEQLASVRVSISPLVDCRSNSMLPTQEIFEGVASGVIDSQSSLGWSALSTYFFSTQFDSKQHRDVSRLLKELRGCRNGKTWSLITVAQAPMMTRVLSRGNWQDESGEIVSPAVPGFLPQPEKALDQRLTRLDLARWLVSKENPLTARVFVNRLWKQLFGNGLSVTVDDVGTQGEPPSHFELLDWLAAEFIESGWDVKHMVRLMVTSEAYQRTSRVREDLKDIDPSNRMLASQNPRRLDAEFVRDNALSIAGLLDLSLIGGPSCKPYQPSDYYESLQFPDRDYVADSNYGQFRRGVYMHWQRTFLHPMVANFDGPSREECIANRVASNTPQQALTLLNDPTMVEAARVMAMAVLKMPVSKNSPNRDLDRIEFAVKRALARSPSAEEKTELIEFLGNQRQHYLEDEESARHLSSTGISEKNSSIPPNEHAAWMAVCRVILNLHETITRF